MSERTSAHADDIESGTLEGNGQNPSDTSNIDEYIGLDRYISSLRDSRRLSAPSGSNGEAAEENHVPWWAPWRRFRRTSSKKNDSTESTNGEESFTIPDEWLDTNLHIVKMTLSFAERKLGGMS